MISLIIKNFRIVGGVTVERRGAGTHTKGRYAHGAVSEVAVATCAAHPATGATLQRLPEGLRAKEAFTFYFDEEVRTAKQGVCEADVVVWGSKRYELEVVEDWSDRGGFWVGHGVLTLATITEPSP